MKKLSLFKLNRQIKLNSLSHSWNFYLYMLKYNVLTYYTYDGMQTALIQKLKNYLNKNNNKLIILNKHQISYFFRKTNSSAFNWLKTGQHLIIMFRDFNEATLFFEEEIAKQLAFHYKLITISYKGVYLNLLWDSNILPQTKFKNLYKLYNNQNAIVLYWAIHSTIISLIYCINYFIQIIIINIKILSRFNNINNKTK